MRVFDTISSLVAGTMGIVSPLAAARYLVGRETLRRVAGYGAARRDGPNGQWLAADGNINLRNSRDRAIIQARARQIVDDNPNLAGAIQKIINNVIFTGIRPQARIIGADGLPHTAANDAVERDFAEWAGHQRWHDLTALALRHCWIDGGCLLHFFPRRDLLREGLPPIGVELLDLDSLDTSAGTARGASGARIFSGIEVDDYGNPAAFHVRRNEVFTCADGRLLADTERLPASSCRLVMRRTRIGQILPVSWMHAVISTVHDLDEYQSSERIAARLAAAFGVFVVLPPEMPGNDLNGRPMPALSGGVDTMQRLISGKDFISQGRIDALPPGADIKVAEYNRPGGSYEPFVKTTQRSASAGMGLSHEAFSNDFSDASFSSVRQAVLEERRAYKMQQHFVVEELCRPLWKQWTACRAVFSQGSAVVPVRWQKPGWSWVDPLKDANASTVRVNLGIVSRRELCEEEGRDYDEVQQQLAEESRLADTGGNHDTSADA